MKKMWIAGIALLVICSGALAGPKEDAMVMLDKWVKAFRDSDVDTIVSLYAPDALFFGTGSKVLVIKTADVRKYFEQALLTNKPKSAELGDHSVMVVSDSVVAVTGLDKVGGVRDGAPYAAVGRVSFVVAKRGDTWQIVHFHRSAVPNQLTIDA